MILGRVVILSCVGLAALSWGFLAAIVVLVAVYGAILAHHGDVGAR